MPLYALGFYPNIIWYQGQKPSSTASLHEALSVEIIAFDTEDVIRTSGGDNGGGDWGEIDP